MINSSLEIADEDKSKLSGIIAYQGTTFSDLVRISGLSKSTDFVGADLSDVDFSNSDLSGFDFTDADLSGTYGINVKIDRTTILTGTYVQNSVFALEKEKREFFTIHDDHIRLYERLKKEYWTTGALWAAQNLKRSSKNFEVSAKIAKYLYANVRDQTYKNQILYGIFDTFKSRDEYKYFLLNQLIDPYITLRSLRAVLDVLTRSFVNDPTVKQLRLHYLAHSDSDIRKLSIPVVMAKKFFRENRDAVLAQVHSEPDRDVRQLFTKYFAANAGGGAEAVFFRNENSSFHDYAEPIDDRIFEQMMRNATRRFKKIRLSSAGRPLLPITTFAEIAAYMDKFEPEIRKVQAMGLPLKLVYSIEELRSVLPGSATGGAKFD